MNKTAAVIAVGDKFKDFASLDGVLTVSRLTAMLDGDAAPGTVPHRVVVGQGVPVSSITYLRRRALARGIPLQFLSCEHIEDRTGRRYSHKHQLHNVLITDPVKLAENRYALFLSIDEHCEILADHTTGLHLQGMVLIEAARQSFLAVSEWFLLPKGREFYFVINRFNTDFKRFAFPVPTTIEVEMTSVKRRGDERMSAETTIEITQLGEVVCRCQISYSAIDNALLSQKERDMACTVAAHVLELHARPRIGEEAVAA